MSPVLHVTQALHVAYVVNQRWYCLSAWQPESLVEKILVRNLSFLLPIFFPLSPFLPSFVESQSRAMDLSEPGVGDFVLLDTISEEAFMKNLELRFQKDRIYVSLHFFPSFFTSLDPLRPELNYNLMASLLQRKGKGKD